MAVLALSSAAAAQEPPQGQPGTDQVPALAQRDQAPATLLAVRGFAVEGVGPHSGGDITQAGVQKIADAKFEALAEGHSEARLRFDQLQAVANAVTAAYRKAGYVVATAIIPVQTIGADRIVRLQVIEGRIGKVIVQGTTHYDPDVIAAALNRLQGRALRAQEVSSAMLYAHDLPGVSVSSILQPGQNDGETDLVLTAQEEKHPVSFDLGVNNYGTELTGKYRALAGVTWDNPIGRGDRLAASFAYAFEPESTRQGALSYSVPISPVPGLSFLAGYSRSELQVNTGLFSVLGIQGPSSNTYVGADWKFVNTSTLQMQGSFRYLRERSQLSALGEVLSDLQFDAAELGFAMRRTDVRWRGVDLLTLSVRQAVDDQSRRPDDLYPDHDSRFLVMRASYSRLQYLAPTQRLVLRVSGQYTRDALTPMEQFALGGPDNVRAYPLADALGDRAWAGSLEYHVDAPGFADRTSPFNGRPWRDLLEFSVFADHGQADPVGANDTSAHPSVRFGGVGVGASFRLPQTHNLQLDLTASVPTTSTDASDGKDGVRVYARFGMTF
ncbi:ShlB/FhaC/HecB family hemolysin secretion/activation protein [Pseudoxanthomonas sp.]|uniref:ShlB/FhaC/HecB family hemolysin secretion/activation protein n=1 Tax=Pseudoxanthomonas sp. TaxID=1871049 RepID=UPI002614E65F|nr:ShlB/FhaC/HecB family hemolysin secretion/activation protein [Pseudoxanthomonas sp.]WDS37798.1 MAG: ShlB/FhaC/HecB family hemolysin secretion/activation protein [Pseudoxanthomonas sp.]